MFADLAVVLRLDGVGHQLRHQVERGRGVRVAAGALGDIGRVAQLVAVPCGREWALELHGVAEREVGYPHT
ncbi:hypothetical protein [Kitasatospora sp. NPDC096140]|uniref:hypothetical protein n=1 Tax=Kitasatospora sp. NPDC096140 TaxID=3155425 RepID=UPI003333F470